MEVSCFSLSACFESVSIDFWVALAGMGRTSGTVAALQALTL